MKIHKLEVIVIDFDDIGAEEIKDVLENARYPNRCISPDVRKVETREFGEWDDGHPLNNRNTADAEIERIFATQ